MTALQRRNRPNGHGHEVDPILGTTQCPYCGQPVTRKEFQRIRARIEAEERARIAKVEAALKDRFAREKVAAETQAKAAVEKARREAVKAAEAQIKTMRANQEVTIAARLRTQRETLVKQTAEAVNAERVKHFEEKTRLEAALATMTRKLQGRTAWERGEPAEVDLYKMLVTAFPDDRVARVRKGKKGPDVIIEIVHNGAVAGKVVIDSKAHARWSNRFITKLKADQRAAGADFAVLSTSVFPQGGRQLLVLDGVIIADPARVIAVVQMLRRQIVQSHLLRLSIDDRNDKADKLLAFIMSPAAGDLFERLGKAADAMVDLDAKEVDAHHGVWRKRGELIRAVQKVNEELAAKIDSIVGGDDAPHYDGAPP